MTEKNQNQLSHFLRKREKKPENLEKIIRVEFQNPSSSEERDSSRISQRDNPRGKRNKEKQAHTVHTRDPILESRKFVDRDLVISKTLYRFYRRNTVTTLARIRHDLCF